MSELPDDVLELQQRAFRYFLDHTNARNGLVADNTRKDSPCSIAATGLGLSCHPVAVSNGWLKREDAAERVLATLRFFEQSPQGPELCLRLQRGGGVRGWGRDGLGTGA